MKKTYLKRANTIALAALVSSALSTTAIAADESKDKWDITKPPFPLSSVSINTNETTWSNLDVAPDGKEMVFDMLGNLFTVSVNGGTAKALTDDFAWDLHPAISPDGSQIAFISDRDGVSNVWVMDRDGENLKQVTKSKNDIIHSPKWSPDGQYIVVTKGIMSRRSIPAGEVWLYHVAGGNGIPIKKRVNGEQDQKNIADPVFSADGQYIYYTQDVTSGSVFSYNRDPLKSLFAITRYDRETGKEERFAGGSGGAIVPTPSPDGKSVAFLRRVRENTVLFIKDLETGNEKPLFAGMERDMQEGFGSEGYFAYFDWTPDSSEIVFWTGGKFHRINVADQSLTTLNVNVSTEMQYADAVRFDVDVAPDEFDIKMIRWPQKSPDGKSIIFQALGKLYVHDMKTGKHKRLTKQNDHDEYFPRFSNDGKSIVYTTWNDKNLGSVRTVSARGGKGKVVTQTPGHYAEPSFSIDGNKVTYRKFTGGYLLTPEYSINPGIYVADLDSGINKRVAKSGMQPHFAGDSDRVYYTDFTPGSSSTKRQLMSVNLDGLEERVHLTGNRDAIEFRLSHDKKWIAFTHQYNAYIAAYADSGKPVDIGPNMKTLPVKQVSKRAGQYLTWSADNQSLSWHHGARFFERDLKDSFDFVEGATDELADMDGEGINLSFKAKLDKPTGVKALVGGRVVTMRNASTTKEVIENGVVVIEGNKIIAVGKSGDVSIPKGALLVDAKGKTIIPGLVDTHAHGGQGSSQIIPEQNWTQYSNLAFGVTTIHDPSNDTGEIFSAAELQKTGDRVAPRIFSTGTILYGAEWPAFKAIINSYEDAKFHLQRMKDVGAISVKSYNQPRRDQRQQILAAARDLGLMVVPEGGGKFHQNMTMLVDGHTSLEHSLPIARGYNDVTSLWKETEFGYTPTFVVSYGGLSGEVYWYDRTEVWKNPRLMRYTPQFIVDGRAIRRPTAPDEQYNHFEVAKYAKELSDNGVSVHIGAHGQREGLAAHWEMWLMEQGGFSAWEAIRGATIDGATHLGMGKQIGSIEVGKLADLAIIDGNPLDNLRRSEYVSYTVINGRIYSAETMNELGSKDKRAPFFFEELNTIAMPPETQAAIEEKQHRYHWRH
jgi:Tol biopolymer transport system component/imidazolonepropionase-like amidohydrolase